MPTLISGMSEFIIICICIYICEQDICSQLQNDNRMSERGILQLIVCRPWVMGGARIWKLLI